MISRNYAGFTFLTHKVREKGLLAVISKINGFINDNRNIALLKTSSKKGPAYFHKFVYFVDVLSNNSINIKNFLSFLKIIRCE